MTGRVLRTWSEYWPDDDVRAVTVAETLHPVVCAKGLRVLPDQQWSTTPELDVLVYPGGQGTRAQLETSDPIHQRLQALSSSGTLMTSVCTGSLVFAAAGLLRKRAATTHWASLDLLRSLDPTIEVRESDRYVDEGSVVTAAGVSAGIDVSLHLIRRLHSAERAAQVRRAIQYDPEPPV